MIGTQLSHFRILRKLGAGGMGEVYEAEDVSLGRRVALKILPAAVQNDAEALERFRREARSASALHHANICTIYEVGADQGRHFIAMEMLEGTALDDMIGGKPMKITTVLDIGTQVGEALRAAHEAGVIHRDIKPANIFVTRTGMVKLLDFGIAKQSYAARGAAATAGEDADTLALGSEDFSMTRPGTAVGTVAYMSPEQASGQALDSRTDLFSLGAVLYEMVTGQQPFTGATSAVIFNAILSQAPAAPISLNGNCPPELEAAIHKCLEKDRELRCQSAAELRADLMRIRRKLDSGGVSTAQQAVASAVTTGAAPTRSPSSSSVLIAEAKRHKLGASFVLLVVVALVAGAGYGIYSAIATQPFPFQHNEMRRVQDDATVLFTAISPDGKYLADVHREEQGAESIHLRLLSAASETTVMPAAQVTYGGIAFSRDGTQIYFRRQVQDVASGAYSLYRVPQLGGTPMLVAENVPGDPAFSPDGNQMAFMQAANDQVSVVLADAAGNNQKTLVSGLARPQPLSWSADGKTIIAAIAPASDANAGLGGNLTAINVSDGTLKSIPVPRDKVVSRPQWYPDSEGVLALYRSAAGIGRSQIAFIDYPEGKLHPVTNDTNTYSSLSLSGDGKILAAVETTADDRNLFLMPAGETGAGRGQQLTDHRTVRGFAWMPDGTIAAAPDFSLVTMDAKGDVKATLMDTENGAQAIEPSACANGRDVVFASIGNAGSAKLSIWRMDAGGGNMQPVSDGSLDRYPVCAADSKSVFFARGGGGSAAIMQVSISGAAAQKATDLVDWRGWFFDISSDGKLLAMITPTPAPDGRPELAIVKLGSTEPPRKFPVPPEIASGPRFMPGSESVAYAVRRNGADNLWQQVLTGTSAAHPITQFTSDEITDFHWSPHGNRLGIVRGHTDSGVVLLRDTAAHN